jgi:hypothetical protein
MHIDRRSQCPADLLAQLSGTVEEAKPMVPTIQQEPHGLVRKDSACVDTNCGQVEDVRHFAELLVSGMTPRAQ